MENDNSQFGLTQEDIKNNEKNAFLGRIKYYFSAIEPTAVKMLNGLIYYTIKFIKAVVSSVFKMILGKEV